MTSSAGKQICANNIVLNLMFLYLKHWIKVIITQIIKNSIATDSFEIIFERKHLEYNIFDIRTPCGSSLPRG